MINGPTNMYCGNDWIIRLMSRWDLWINGSSQPHLCLPSGKHTGGYLNVNRVFQDTRTVEDICKDLLVDLRSQGLNLDEVGEIVGAGRSTQVLSYEFAKQLDRFCSYSQFQPDGSYLLETYVNHGEKFLVIGDVFSSGETISGTIKAIQRAGGVVIPMIPVILNRSNMQDLSGMRIVSLMEIVMPSYDPNECPFCKEGLRIIDLNGLDELTKQRSLSPEKFEDRIAP